MKKKLLSIFALSIFSLTFAQVGIGTETPDKSAVLDINATKTDASGNKTLGGLLLPTVTLKGPADKATIIAPKEGLMVYSDGKDANFPTRGFYTWDGSEWKTVNISTSALPEITDIDCSTASFSPNSYTGGQEITNGRLVVSYNGGNGAAYSGALSDSGPFNGLYYKLSGGHLANGTGDIVYNVHGTTDNDKPTTFPIQFLGKGPCEATVGGSVVIDNIKYARKVVPLNLQTTANSVTNMGNLLVRYNSGDNVAVSGYIEFTTLVDTHVTWTYHKGGRQMANIEAYGTTASVKEAEWHKFLATAINGNGGPTAAEKLNTANLNPGNRDLGYATLTLHNTGEVYRVTLNASTGIPASGGVPAAEATVTIYIERFE